MLITFEATVRKCCYGAVFIANTVHIVLLRNSQLHNTTWFPWYNERDLVDASPHPTAHDTSRLYISASVYTQFIVASACGIGTVNRI